MLDPELLEKLQDSSVDEQISLIEAILRSLKDDLKKDAFPGSESVTHSQRLTFGFMKDTGKIIGDVVAPVLPENVWEAFQ